MKMIPTAVTYWINYFAPIIVICMFVCIFVHVTYGIGSVLFWQCCDSLCTWMMSRLHVMARQRCMLIVTHQGQHGFDNALYT